jgi:PAS domain S-box-containing protein
MSRSAKTVSSPTSRRLIRQIIFFGAALTVLLSALQSWFEYRQGMDDIRKELAEIRLTQVTAIATSLWNFDREQLDAQLEGLSNHSSIVYAAVFDGKTLVAERGERQADARDCRIPLSHGSKNPPMGSLYLQISSAKVVQAVFHRFLWTVLGQAMVVFAVGTLLFLLIERQVTRHLAAAASHFRSFDVGSTPTPLHLDKSRHNDELDVLADAFNQMSENLRQSYDRLLAAQRRLADNESRYRNLLDTIPQKVFYKDLDSVYVTVNPNFARDFGLTPETMAGKTDKELLPPELAERFRAGDQRVMWSEMPEEADEPYLLHGEGRIVHMVKVPVHNEGRVAGVLGIFWDITEQKRIIAALHENEEKYRSLFETAPDAVLILDRQNTQVLDANHAACELYGYDPDELRQKFAADLSAESDALIEMVQAGDRLAPMRMHRKKDGALFPVEMTTSVLQQGGHDIVVVFVRDITARRQAERELQEHREHLEELVKERTAELLREKQFNETLIDSLPGIFYVVGGDGRLVRWNRNLESVTGGTAEELGRSSLFDIVAPEDRPLVSARIKEVLASGTGLVAEVCLLARNDRRIPHYITGERTWLGEVPYLLGVGIDITARRQAEVALSEAKQVAEAASRAKSVFLANMSHEIRTPMNAILGFTQLLQRDPAATPMQLQRFDTISRSGEHLLGLINDVLEMSKIESGRIALNPTPFDLYALLEDVGIMFREPAMLRHLEFSIERAPSLPPHVEADEGKLRQILINLLGNAVKFTEKGMVVLRVRAEMALGGGWHLVAEVEDSGPGIASDEIPRLFQPFAQASAGLRSGAGTGLGLAISREFARMMGGEIAVSSQLGRGSIFRLEIPLRPVSALEVRRRRGRVIGLQPGQPSCRVLVADDREENREVLSGMLESAGFEVRQVSGGQEAINLFAAWRPRIILMDMRMPGMDGAEAIRRIRAMRGGGEVKIVSITASAFEEDRQVALAAGADAFIAKPFQETDLFAKIGVLARVKYLHSGPVSPSLVPRSSPPAAAVLSACLPGPLVDSMVEAVAAADLERLTGLIAAAEKIAPPAAAHLRRLAEKFEYDRLVAWLTQTGD